MIKTLSKSIREYKKYAMLSPLFVALEVVMECLIPFIMAKLINEISADSLNPVIKYGIILIILAIFALFLGVASGKVASVASCGFAKNLRHDLFYNIQNFSFAEIDKYSASSLITRMTTDVTNVQMAFQMSIRIAVRTPLMMIFSLIMSFSINWKLSLIFLAAMPILALFLWLIIRKAIPLFRNIFKKYDRVNNIVQENVGGIRTVKSYVREEHEKEKFENAVEVVRDDFTKAEKLIALNNPLLVFCIYLTTLLVSFFGAKIIITSGGTTMNTGDLSALINYAVQILFSLLMFSMVMVILTIASESGKRIAEVINQNSTLEIPANGKTNIENGSIEFENVSFKYSEKAKNYALKNINLNIKSGETIGIIGETGSAKTTLVQLIPRLYDATKGCVKIGGTDVKDYDIKSLRNNVAMVLQKNVLFAGTIKENIRWGDKNATDDEIKHVCKLAQADEFIMQFPEKYDTQIKQGGTNVSGGQKQRLCIARALLKKPKILILDDSTSAVDTKTDALIRSAFRNEIPNTTKIIIAQRIASVEEADKIIVMQGGTINGMGTHTELMETNAIYREIYNSQTQHKGAENETACNE